MNVLIISMPWRKSTLPAIGASLLKAALMRDGHSCDVGYFNLSWEEIVKRKACQISNKTPSVLVETGTDALFSLAGYAAAADYIFSADLHTEECIDPHLRHKYESDFLAINRSTFGQEIVSGFLELSAEVPGFLDNCLEKYNYEDYDFVGFSSVLYQQTASLALARRLKAAYPDSCIVFGGALCEDEMGKALLRNYDFIDYVFSGEADHSFPNFVNEFANQKYRKSKVANLLDNLDNRFIGDQASSMIRQMDSLPFPNYDDFYEQYRKADILKKAPITLPVEGSRGCWWGQKKHCIFCGLNGNGMDYRLKSAERIFDEIDYLDARYKPSRIGFTDNIISTKYFKEVFPKFKEKYPSTEFFAEIKSNIKRSNAQTLKQARFNHVQPGIESLNTSVLTEMHKGVSALGNVACLKFLREVAVGVCWNFLYGFPNETPDDYRDALRILRALTHLDPPGSISPMRLVRFSPSYTSSAELGFFGLRPASYYKCIYPFPEEELRDLAISFDFDFTEPREPERYLSPIKDFCNEWSSANKKFGSGILVYEQLGDGSAVIHDTRFNRKKESHYLDAFESHIYKYCDLVRSREKIVRYMTGLVDEHSIQKHVNRVLSSFEDDLIMVRDGEKFLSVAMSNYEYVPWLAIASLSSASCREVCVS